MDLDFFAGRDPHSGNIFLLNISEKKLLDLTPDQMALMTVHAMKLGIPSGFRQDNTFFVGLPSQMKAPHYSLRIQDLYFEGSMGETAEDAVARLTDQLRSGFA